MQGIAYDGPPSGTQSVRSHPTGVNRIGYCHAVANGLARLPTVWDDASMMQCSAICVGKVSCIEPSACSGMYGVWQHCKGAYP